ncbi:hypothetical protein PR048_024086 [Dryococelus australis]|uniref:Doublecortin domain-containing protein n=1 Tax=Dryococelus australis TaxID=614101 RepID=A0ABQ9GVW7_9NEOP|nr:hypothetical protein PR048_024086 [Dryococelus australis]
MMNFIVLNISTDHDTSNKRPVESIGIQTRAPRVGVPYADHAVEAMGRMLEGRTNCRVATTAGCLQAGDQETPDDGGRQPISCEDIRILPRRRSFFVRGQDIIQWEATLVSQCRPVPFNVSIRLELFCAYDASRSSSCKVDSCLLTTCLIASTRQTLNWRAVFTSANRLGVANKGTLIMGPIAINMCVQVGGKTLQTAGMTSFPRGAYYRRLKVRASSMKPHNKRTPDAREAIRARPQAERRFGNGVELVNPRRVFSAAGSCNEVSRRGVKKDRRRTYRGPPPRHEAKQPSASRLRRTEHDGNNTSKYGCQMNDMFWETWDVCFVFRTHCYFSLLECDFTLGKGQDTLEHSFGYVSGGRFFFPTKLVPTKRVSNELIYEKNTLLMRGLSSSFNMPRALETLFQSTSRSLKTDYFKVAENRLLQSTAYKRICFKPESHIPYKHITTRQKPAWHCRRYRSPRFSASKVGNISRQTGTLIPNERGQCHRRDLRGYSIDSEHVFDQFPLQLSGMINEFDSSSLMIAYKAWLRTAVSLRATRGVNLAPGEPVSLSPEEYLFRCDPDTLHFLCSPSWTHFQETRDLRSREREREREEVVLIWDSLTTVLPINISARAPSSSCRTPCLLVSEVKAVHDKVRTLEMNLLENITAPARIYFNGRPVKLVTTDGTTFKIAHFTVNSLYTLYREYGRYSYGDTALQPATYLYDIPSEPPAPQMGCAPIDCATGDQLQIKGFRWNNRSLQKYIRQAWRSILYRQQATYEVSVERPRNARAGETGDPRENSPTNSIFRRDSHVRKSGSDPAGNQIQFVWVGSEQPNHYTTAAPRTATVELSTCRVGGTGARPSDHKSATLPLSYEGRAPLSY